MTLEHFIPTMRFPLPLGYQFRKVETSASTASYNPGVPAPEQEGRPAFIIHDPSLPARMLESLVTYLQTAPGRHLEPSLVLVQSFAALDRALQQFTLNHERSTDMLFQHALFPICCAVQEVDANETLPEPAFQQVTYNQIPDSLYRPRQGTDPQLHVELKSWTAFSRHAEHILRLGVNRTPLELQATEGGHRSIIFKVCCCSSYRI